MKMLGISLMAGFLAAGCTPPTQPAAKAKAEEITFKGAGAVELPGTLLIPEKAPAPFVVLFPGSGPTDRDGNQLPTVKTDLLKELAEHLQKQGIGSLRYDKRATPKVVRAALSDPSLELSDWASWANHKADAIAAVEYVRSRPELLDGKIGLIGHSEGGLQTLAIANNAQAASVVLLASPGRPLDVVLREQITSLLIRQDPPASVREEYLKELDRLLKEVKNDGTVSRVPAGLQAIFNDSTSSFLKDLFAENPQKLAEEMNCPAFIVIGDKDKQIHPERDGKALYDALAAKSNKNMRRLSVLPGLSHNFKWVENPEEDAGFEGKLPEPFLDQITEWLQQTL